MGRRNETFKNVVEEFTGNVVTAEKLAESIKLINNKRKALERLYNLRKNENLPISGCDVLLISQIAFYDDPARFTQMTNKLCDELDQRVKDGVSVVPAGTKRIMLTGTPLAIPNWKLHNIVETSGLQSSVKRCVPEPDILKILSMKARQLWKTSIWLWLKDT